MRRRWIRRIIDHDGDAPGQGGIEAWLRLGEACGLTREEISDHRHLVPGVRFAVDAYVTFARTRPWVEAVASSLTELFAPDLMAERLAAFEQHYTWIDPDGLAYFRARLEQAPRDSEHALEVVTRALPDPVGPRRRGGRAVVQVRRPLVDDGRDRPGLGDGPMPSDGAAPRRHHRPSRRRPALSRTCGCGSTGPGSGTCCWDRSRWSCSTRPARTSSGCATGGGPCPTSPRSCSTRYDRVVDDEVAAFLARLVAKRCVEIDDGP